MSDNNDIQSVIDVVKSCDDLILCTNRMDGYPDARHVANMMNKDVKNLDLHFLTGADTPKFKQIMKNHKCCLYYFNPQNRYAVRLYGEITPIDNLETKRQYWRDDFKNFGYLGADDPEFMLLEFKPHSYKFYVGNEMRSGII